MKVLLAAIFLVALVALVSAGFECTKENVDKMCGPEGQAKKKEMMEKMTAECKAKLEPFAPECKKICDDYNSDKNLEKACAAKKTLWGKISGVEGVKECFPKKD